MLKKTLNVNGISRTVLLNPTDTLSTVLRNQLLVLGVKVGCDEGQCGACNVIMNGKLIRSCITKMTRVPEGAEITTIEGIGTPDNLHPIQLAWIRHGGAQCGFCTPGFIVSSKALLDANPNPTRNDIRDWFQKYRNACRCTGYKQLVDSVMDAAKVINGEMTKEELAFQIPEDGRIWSSSMPRPTAVAKVTGTWMFGADQGILMPDNALQIAMVQAEVSHANILSIDTSEAEKMPGVYKVLTHKDVKGKNRISGLITFPTNKGDGWDRPILCDEKVFQYGDAIALVCADTKKNADAAAAMVKVDLEPLPEYMSAPAAMAEDAIEIHPGTPMSIIPRRLPRVKRPRPFSIKPIMSLKAITMWAVSPICPLNRMWGLPISMRTTNWWFTPNPSGCTCTCTWSLPVLVLSLTTWSWFRIPPAALSVTSSAPPWRPWWAWQHLPPVVPAISSTPTDSSSSTPANGLPFSPISVLPLIRQVNLRPWKPTGPLTMVPIQNSATFWPCAVPSSLVPDMTLPISAVKAAPCAPTIAGGSAFRGYGAPESEFGYEVLMDELAEKIGMDPLELRYLNVYRDGATTPTGCAPDAYSLPDLIDLIRPKYKAAKDKAAANSTDDIKRGVGVSVGVYGCGLDGPDTAEIDVELNADNTVTIFATWHDHGQGADSGTLGSAHEALRPMKISPDQIKLVLNDTSQCPNAGPAGGSRSQMVVGQAILNGCQALVAAAQKADGTYRNYDEMKADGIETKFHGKWSAPCADGDENAQGDPLAGYMYGVFMSEVAVETSTGKTTVEGMTIAADVGVINNKLTVDGQIYGGVAQGIGLALTEDYEDIKRHATLAGAGFPYIKQIPDKLEIMYIETPRERGPFGAAGVGELPLTTPHAAVINAIYNACGARVRDLPARPEKVLAAMPK